MYFWDSSCRIQCCFKLLALKEQEIKYNFSTYHKVGFRDPTKSMLFALLCLTLLMQILQSLTKRESRSNQRATDGTIFLKSNEKNYKQEPTKRMNCIAKYLMFYRLNFFESLFGEDDIYQGIFSTYKSTSQNCKKCRKNTQFYQNISWKQLFEKVPT